MCVYMYACVCMYYVCVSKGLFCKSYSMTFSVGTMRSLAFIAFKIVFNHVCASMGLSGCPPPPPLLPSGSKN